MNIFSFNGNKVGLSKDHLTPFLMQNSLKEIKYEYFIV